MKLEWIRGNDEDITGKTVSYIDNPVRMSIHKCFRCGDSLFFTCNDLGIHGVNLDTENCREAKEIAFTILKNRCNELIKKINQLDLYEEE